MQLEVDKQVEVSQSKSADALSPLKFHAAVLASLQIFRWIANHLDPHWLQRSRSLCFHSQKSHGRIQDSLKAVRDSPFPMHQMPRCLPCTQAGELSSTLTHCPQPE